MSCFVQAQWLQTSATLLFQNPGRQITQGGVTQDYPVGRIDKCEVRNNEVTAATMTLYIVPNGATPDDSMIRLSKEVAPGITDLCQAMVGHDLDRGDSIYGMSSDADTLSIRISGRYVE